MDLEKIKKFVSENRKLVLIVVVLLLIGAVFLHQNQKEEVNNDNFMQTAIQSSSVSDQRTSSSSTDNVANSSQSKTVTCDISGAVKHEGVYTLKNGARLDELIAAAGGLRSNAQVKAINRAIILKDQDKIHIPFKGEKVDNITTVNSASDSSAANSSSGTTGEKVNLNTASAADLQKLNGIGEKKAEQIVAYREQNGQFKKIEDLMQVSGIGEKTFAGLKDQLEI
ncbi:MULTISPECIES: helix-hairpin-helix domain-containing protein [Lactobacillus]|uniref:ComEA family DNA-binding protein n=1 Tax=Lactobacillus xujianguonis TaxID=2495899 RepID=A0A437SUN3_9LACO|nr:MULTISPECIES: helix-hairpin-helix domain-containing protein [Lactobacillus]RVU70653.1 ComEA family DNA-binding protein [Lactobacillus xujianguonis]